MPNTTYTFPFATTAEGWTRSGNGTGAFTDADGNPAGCLTAAVTGRNTTATGTWAWSGDFEDLGVPAGATVTGYSAAAFDHRCAVYSTGGTPNDLLLRINDGTERELVAAEAFTATTSWATKSASLTITGLSLASTTAVTLEVPYRLRTANNVAATVELRFDTVSVTIEYDDSPDEYTQGTSGSLSTSGSVSTKHTPDKYVSGSLTSSGSIATIHNIAPRELVRDVSGSLTSSGSVATIHTVAQTFFQNVGGSLTPSGFLNALPSLAPVPKTTWGSVRWGEFNWGDEGKTYFQNVGGTLSSTGMLDREHDPAFNEYNQGVSGVLSSSGTVGSVHNVAPRELYQDVSGTLSSSGTVDRVHNVAPIERYQAISGSFISSGTVDTVHTIARMDYFQEASGSLAPSGSVNIVHNVAPREFFKDVGGSLFSSGGADVIFSITQQVFGTMSAEGVIRKGINKPTAGLLRQTGSDRKHITITKYGTASFLKTSTKRTATTKGGNISYTGTTEPTFSITQFIAGSLGMQGLVSRGVSRLISGVLAHIGNTSKRTSTTKHGSSSFSTNFIKRVLTTKGGSVSSTGAVASSLTGLINMGGALVSSGTLLLSSTFAVALNGLLTSTGGIGKITIKGISGALSSASHLIKATSRSVSSGVLTFYAQVGRSFSGSGVVTARWRRILNALGGLVGKIK